MKLEKCFRYQKRCKKCNDIFHPENGNQDYCEIHKRYDWRAMREQKQAEELAKCARLKKKI